MCDFDLSQALEGSDDETRPDPACFDMPHVLNAILRLDGEVDLNISCKPNTMQCVVNVVLAVNRLKKSLSWCQSDEQLCCMILDSLVDEKVFQIVQNIGTSESKVTYQRSSHRPRQCTLCDTSQKDVVHFTGEMKLHALTLKGGNSDRKVLFELVRYLAPVGGESQIVALSISQSNWYITCSMKDDKAVLLLEECSGEKLQRINGGEDMDRFLFMKRTRGMSLTTFESVACRGWYISTSPEDEQPVDMCQVDTSTRLTCFKQCNKN
ncbi:interleukin-1 beta [Thalassophryne amazonica]|uniref:interleukin-1 beta n=1 Tax=Thalassophryne amazonica TaxID=390379 RepID=UPI0014717D01|nr:interleukin-1 beta [Thalassophryne amazonica]